MGRRWREYAFVFNVRDHEGSLGKRSWTSGRGLGVAWTLFGAPGDVRGRFGG